MNIAIIPAKKNSLRIKNKNIKCLDGKPIILHVIDKLKQTKLFSQIIVSTDSKKIKKLVEMNGAEVPYLRSKKLSDNHSSTKSVIMDVVKKNFIKNLDKKFIFCFYSTSVFFSKKNLIEGINLLKKNKKKFIFTATEYDHPVQRGFYSEKKLLFFDKKSLKKRTQDLKRFYHDAAQFYLAVGNTWLEKKEIINQKSLYITLNKNSVVDIDDLEDWKAAEIMWRHGNE